uniref:Uncharacterized protein n=1 Tax=viral metagenome TaxID=1070528 RepID=A0A6M3LX54_9ZZZZ
MKIWLISQSVNGGYGTYDSAVVVAESEEEAKIINPGGRKKNRNGDRRVNRFKSWCHRKDVTAKLLGEAIKGVKKGVVCASYHEI